MVQMIRVRAFLTGCLSSLLALLPTSMAVAQSQPLQTDSNGIYREFPEFQDFPVTPDEQDDAFVAMAAGLSYEEAVNPQPIQNRDYAAMLEDVWSVLFDSSFTFNQSALYFVDWPMNQAGQELGFNDTGSPVVANILLSLDTPPDEVGTLTAEEITSIESSGVRFGAALVELQSTLGIVRVSCVWMRVTDIHGQSVTKLFPLGVILDEVWNGMAEYFPFMMDVFEDLSEYPESANPWQTYKDKVAKAAKKWRNRVGRAIAGAAVIAAVGLLVGTASPAIAIAAVVLILLNTLNQSEDFQDAMQDAVDDLRQQMIDDGVFHPSVDPSNYSDQEIIDIAKEVYSNS